MRLPVQQYSVLDPKLITMIGENRFQLKVPRVDVSIQTKFVYFSK